MDTCRWMVARWEVDSGGQREGGEAALLSCPAPPRIPTRGIPTYGIAAHPHPIGMPIRYRQGWGVWTCKDTPCGYPGWGGAYDCAFAFTAFTSLSLYQQWSHLSRTKRPADSLPFALMVS